MTRTTCGLTALALLGLCGCGKDDAEHLAHIANTTAQRLDGACGGGSGRVGESWEAARAGWSSTALDGRVRLRLRWDKTLAGTNVEVRSGGPGVVRLRGEVDDAALHEHILDIAAATVGVEKIVDELKVTGVATKEAEETAKD